MSHLVQKTSTGDVTTALTYLKSAVIEHTATATLEVRAGGSGGALILTLRCAANDSAEWIAGAKEGVACPGGIHATLSAGVASIEYA